MPELDRDALLGLPRGEAEQVARDLGWQVRTLRPGDLATMDFRDDRLNLVVDADGVVTDLNLG